MVIVVISNKKNTQPSFKGAFTYAANSLFRNILAASHWFQRFYPASPIPGSCNPYKAKNLAPRYLNIFSPRFEPYAVPPER
jgi:hypothetical protein